MLVHFLRYIVLVTLVDLCHKLSFVMFLAIALSLSQSYSNYISALGTCMLVHLFDCCLVVFGLPESMYVCMYV